MLLRAAQREILCTGHGSEFKLVFVFMSLVKVKPKYQVTLPAQLRQRMGLNVGDLLEAKLDKGRITLTPRTILDRRLAKSLEDFQQGRFYGPFDSAQEMIRSLQRNSKKFRKKPKRS